LVVVPGKAFAYLDEIMENFENTWQIVSRYASVRRERLSS
jgi:hypothetical protein